MEVSIAGWSHVGIRVRELERSLAFYQALGFTLGRWFEGPGVAILDHPSGIELNLIVNAGAGQDGVNPLMDVPEKLPGITHVALRVESTEVALAQLAAAGIAVTGGPDRQGDVAISTFVRDPDRNVVELTEDLRRR